MESEESPVTGSRREAGWVIGFLVAVLLGPPLGGLGYTIAFEDVNPGITAVLLVAFFGSLGFVAITLAMMRGRPSTLQYGVVLLGYLWFTISIADAVVVATPALFGTPTLLSAEELVTGVLVEGHGAFLEVVVIFFAVELIRRSGPDPLVNR